MYNNNKNGQTCSFFHCLFLTKTNLASFSSSTDHDSSELLWDDEFNQDDDDLFGTDLSSEGDYDENVGGGVYGCVGSVHIYHYSTFFGATVLREVLDICPYSSLLVVATKKRGIMAICWASLSRISNIHSKLEKKPREKHSVASPPRVFHSVFSLVCRWIFVNTASRITAYCPNIALS